MHVILIGPQGSGKGTQATILAPRVHLIHLSTGDIFRQAIAAMTPVGVEVKGILDRGDLVPDPLTVRLVAERLGTIPAETSGGQPARGALFDGFPRTVAQAEGLASMLMGRQEHLRAVVELVVPLERLVTRLAGRRVCATCGTAYHAEFNPPAIEGVCDRCGGVPVQRDDDKPEPIRRRLGLFFEQTAPVLSYYRERAMLDQVDGDRPIEEVTAAIEAAITRRDEADPGQPARATSFQTAPMTPSTSPLR